MADPAAVALRFALYIDLMLLFGLAAFGLYALRGSERASRSVLPLRPLLAGAAIVGLGVSVLWLLSLAAAMVGVPVAEVDADTVSMVLSGTSIGAAWLARVAALLLAAVAAALVPRRPRAALATIAFGGVVALGSLAWTGHGAASEGPAGWVHLLADIAHLLAAGVWIGALFAFALLLFRRASVMTAERLVLSHRALSGFSVVGTGAVAVLVVTGAISTWVLVGPDRLAALPTTTYGLLLLVKLALFAGMLGLAAANRFRLTPALNRGFDLSDHLAALRALRLSLLAETASAAAILALVAWLGLLEPPASL